MQNDLVPRESLTDDHRAMVERFSQGETVLIRIAPHMLRLVEEVTRTCSRLAVAPGITESSGANATDVQSLVIPADAEYPNAALALAVFVTNPEVQAAFSKEVGSSLKPAELRGPVLLDGGGGQPGIGDPPAGL